MPHLRCLLVPLAFLLLALVMPAPAHAEENPLDPSPHATPTEAVRHAERRPGGRTAKPTPPVAFDGVGALTKLPDGRLGFMPLLQHHMAVEHWFVEGVDEAPLADAFAGTRRCYVRLRGQLALLGIFGGGGLEWYGTGLRHGKEWGPVMGYHERVYRFEVTEVVWARDRATHLRLQAEAAALAKRVQSLLRSQAYADGLKVIQQALEAHGDTGLGIRGLKILEQHAEMMVLLMSDPSGWSDDDVGRVVRAVLGKPTSPFRELREGAKPRMQRLIASWPTPVHERLGPHLVEGWLAIPYKHVRDGLRPVLAAVQSEAIDDWQARVEEAETRVAAAKQKLKELRETDDYAGLIQVVADAAPYQAVVLDYALGEQQTKDWLPATRRLAALKEAYLDPKRRVGVLVEQIRETIASPTGLPNSTQKPRYNEEIATRFAPRLTAVEKVEVEGVLLDLLRSLDPRKEWRETLLAAELLSAVGGERARAYFPELLRRTRSAPKWQRDHLHHYASAVGER